MMHSYSNCLSVIGLCAATFGEEWSNDHVPTGNRGILAGHLASICTDNIIEPGSDLLFCGLRKQF
jgi:hypothetical protein